MVGIVITWDNSEISGFGLNSMTEVPKAPLAAEDILAFSEIPADDLFSISRRSFFPRSAVVELVLY